MNYITYKEGYKYQLVNTYYHQLSFDAPIIQNIHSFLSIEEGNILVINYGYAWDGPSGPTIDTKNFMRGSLVHDALYQLIREDLLPFPIYKDKADRELQRICKEDGMSSIRAWYVYQAVKNFGKNAASHSGISPTLTAP